MSRRVHRRAVIFSAPALLLQPRDAGGRPEGGADLAIGALATGAVELGGDVDRREMAAIETECITGPLSSAKRSVLSQSGDAANESGS